MITMDKKYQTRDRLPVRIYATDGGGVYPVHGAILYGGEWIMRIWTFSGQTNRDRPSPDDLIEVKPSQIDQMIEWLRTINNGASPQSVFIHDAINAAKRIKAAGE